MVAMIFSIVISFPQGLTLHWRVFISIRRGGQKSGNKKSANQPKRQIDTVVPWITGDLIESEQETSVVIIA